MTNRNSTVFNAYSEYYDLLYRDKDYPAEEKYIRSLLARHGVVKGDILEFGSGTGKHGCLLAEHDFNVHGIELSAEMVAQAAMTKGFTCEQGDIRKVRLGRTYDAVLSLFHVISYQISNDDLKAVFSRASEHLEPGGLFVFDIWYSPAVSAQRPTVRVKRMAGDQVEITRIAEPDIIANENRVDVNYTIFAKDQRSEHIDSLTETHPMRHFSIPEIDLLSESSHFTRIGAEEFLTGNSPSEKTWGICVILRKA